MSDANNDVSSRRGCSKPPDAINNYLRGATVHMPHNEITRNSFSIWRLFIARRLCRFLF